jgi:hypothetical protein|tara:strand:+ start:989 stop:1213 length:225 start_codon:yes stop_codon:yes gene_type:complete
MFKTFVFIFVIGAAPLTIEDELGPYNTSVECFYRGATIIKSFHKTRLAIVKAEAMCLELRKEIEVEEQNVNFIR